ncbi:MAG: hypothetical protein NC082_05530 [Clostridiales bacterium]|nr:hypothetical protein [Clostridiales bacterium]
MSHVIIDFMAAAALSSIIGFAVVSCNSESAEAKAARELYEQAQSENIAGNARLSLELLDSLQHTYKSQTEWQRAAMKLRPTVMISFTEQEIINVTDSIAMLEARYNELLPLMRKVDDKRLVEPYYVDKATYVADFMNGTGIQPRVSEIGQMYFVSSVNGASLKHTGFSLSCDGGSASVGPVAYDGEMNYRIDGSEVVTYSPEQSGAAAKLADDNRGCSMTLTLTGGKNKNLKLSSKQVNGISNCYRFSKSIVDARQLAFERERLQKQLEIARSQAERLAE